MTRILISLLFAGSLLGQLIVPTRAGLVYPVIPVSGSSSTAGLNQTSDLDRAAYVFYAPVTSSGAGLSDVRFEFSAVSSAQPLTVDVQTVAADTGAPSGSLAWTNATGSLATPAVGIHEVALTAAGAVTAGTPLAITIYFTATAGNVTIGFGNIGSTSTGDRGYGTSMDNGGAWTKANSRGVWAAKIDGVWYPVHALGNGGYSNATSIGTSYYGIRIVASDYTARATHVCFLTSSLGGTSEITGVVYSGNSQVAVTAAHDTDILPTSGLVCLPFTGPLIIQRGVGYDVMVYRSAGSGTVNIFKNVYLPGDDMALWEYGNNIHGVNCTGTCETSTNRTAETARRYHVALRLDAIYAGSGGFMVAQ